MPVVQQIVMVMWLHVPTNSGMLSAELKEIKHSKAPRMQRMMLIIWIKIVQLLHEHKTWSQIITSMSKTILQQGANPRRIRPSWHTYRLMMLYMFVKNIHFITKLYVFENMHLIYNKFICKRYHENNDNLNSYNNMSFRISLIGY